jgi:uncharacterized protein with ACT and thioredoxin-like domain
VIDIKESVTTTITVEAENLYDFYKAVGRIPGSGTHVVTGTITITKMEESE